MGHRRRSTRRLGIALAALAIALATPALAQARERAKELGPTPVNQDCLTYRGPNPCFYNLWTSIFQVDRHIVAPGQVLSAQVAVVAGFSTGYVWPDPGGPGLKKIFCPPAPTMPAGKSLRFNTTCTWKAVAPTKKWVLFGPTLTLIGSNPYIDGDYYAVVSGAAVHGRVLDDGGSPVGGVRVLIDGPEDVYATTDAQGTYEAIELQPGNYTVRLAKKGCVDDGVRTVTGKSCKTSKAVKLGTAEVNFKILDRYAIEGKVQDEFKRGLSSVLIEVKTPDGDKIVARSDKNGRYHVGLEGSGAYGLSAVGESRGPNEAYYVMRGDKPSTGTSATVNLSRGKRVVPVNFEVDRTLQFIPTILVDGEESRYATFVGDGAHAGTIRMLVKTQHGDPVIDGVAIRVRPNPGATPRATICSHSDEGYRLRWPGIVGGKPDRTGWIERTGDYGDGSFEIDMYPGTDNGILYVNMTRESDPARSSWDGGMVFYPPPATPMPSGQELQKVLFDALKTAGSDPSMTFADAQGVMEWLVWAREHYTGLAGWDFAPVISTFGRTGVAIFPLGSPPTEGSIGELSGASTRIWDVKATNVFAGDALPLLEEWRTGSGLAAADHIPEAGPLWVGFKTGTPRDPRAYLGWPVPTRGNAYGTCLWRGDDPGATGWGEWMFGTHSPVRVVLTDAAGKRFGVLPSGKTIAQFPGMSWKDGETLWYTVPAGKYKVSVVGSSSGLTTLETRTSGGVTTAQFTAKKGTKTSFALKAKGQLPSFRFGKQKVAPVSGLPLTIKGAPRRLRADRGSVFRVRILDVAHKPVSGALVEYEIDDAKYSMQAGPDGKIDSLLPLVAKGSLRLVVSKHGYRTTVLKIPVR